MSLCNQKHSTALEVKGSSELRDDTPLESLRHIHDWSYAAYKHVEARHGEGKLESGVRKHFLVGSTSRERCHRLRDPMDPTRVMISAEVSFREGYSHGVELLQRERRAYG